MINDCLNEYFHVKNMSGSRILIDKDATLGDQPVDILSCTTK